MVGRELPNMRPNGEDHRGAGEEGRRLMETKGFGLKEIELWKSWGARTRSSIPLEWSWRVAVGRAVDMLIKIRTRTTTRPRTTILNRIRKMKITSWYRPPWLGSARHKKRGSRTSGSARRSLRLWSDTENAWKAATEDERKKSALLFPWLSSTCRPPSLRRGGGAEWRPTTRCLNTRLLRR